MHGELFNTFPIQTAKTSIDNYQLY